MGKYKLQYWLPASFALTFLLASTQVGSLFQLTEKRYVASIMIWSLVFFLILSLAYIFSLKKKNVYRFIFLASLLFTLLLFYIDGEMQGRLFFDVYDAGNAIALLLYGVFFFGLFSLVNMLDGFLMQAYRKIRAKKSLKVVYHISTK